MCDCNGFVGMEFAPDLQQTNQATNTCDYMSINKLIKGEWQDE